jgi:predicted ATPase
VPHGRYASCVSACCGAGAYGQLAKLVSAGILYVKGQPPVNYLFRHALLEEALHSAIDLPQRRRFHQQVGEVMEQRFPHLVETQPELLAQHFTEAGITEKAIGYCLRAGLRSRDRSAHVEAISHLTKGLKLLETLAASPERDARELELLGPLGTAYIASCGYAAPEVGPVFRRARALCERVGRTRQLFATLQRYTTQTPLHISAISGRIRRAIVTIRKITLGSAHLGMVPRYHIQASPAWHRVD